MTPLADSPIDRSEHATVAQTDLRIFDRRLGVGDIRLRVLDIDSEVGFRLFQAGFIGVDLGGTFLALGFGLVEIILRCGVARDKLTLAPLLDLVETQLSVVERQLGP